MSNSKSKLTPTISVIIPVYNGARYLSEAIASVKAQDWPALELIVVDDGSTDQTAAIAKSNSVHYYYQDHAGPGAARNLGVAKATGKFLAFLDADDLWMPRKLTEQMTALSQSSDHALVFGHIEQFISPDLPPAQHPASPVPLIEAGIHVGAMLLERQTFLAVGKFASTWDLGEFIDWYARAQHLGYLGQILPQVVMRRRIHNENLTRRKADSKADYFRVLRAKLNREQSQDRPT